MRCNKHSSKNIIQIFLFNNKSVRDKMNIKDFIKTGDFTLKSGEKSDTYVDLKSIIVFLNFAIIFVIKSLKKTKNPILFVVHIWSHHSKYNIK